MVGYTITDRLGEQQPKIELVYNYTNIAKQFCYLIDIKQKNTRTATLYCPFLLGQDI